MKQNSSPVDPETGEVFDESDELLSYLPEVAAVEMEISTKIICDDLGITSHPRELVAIVFVKLDGTINQLKGEEYWQVFGIAFAVSLLSAPLSAFLTNITGHKRLFKLRIYHCDISNGNIMFIWKNGHTSGILIDFNLAVIAHRRHAQREQLSHWHSAVHGH